MDPCGTPDVAGSSDVKNLLMLAQHVIPSETELHYQFFEKPLSSDINDIHFYNSGQIGNS